MPENALACMSRPGVFVEIRDELVPRRNRSLQLRPECGVLAAVEVFDRHALLLDPGVVAEVENAPPVGICQLDEVIVGYTLEVMPEDLSGMHLIKATRITT